MPASPTSPDRSDRGSPRLPLIPRPRASLLEPILQEGISWEGQVLVVGNDGDIPAMLYVTSNRFLLTNRETILLETPRAWLIPAPLRVQESDIRISITPEGVVPGRGTTERLLLTVREGRGPASQLVAILTGRARKEQINAEFPTWQDGVGAGRSSSLPPLPAFETSQDVPKPKEPTTSDSETRGVAPIEPWADRSERKPRVSFQTPEPEPVEPQSRAARFLSTRSTTPEPAAEPQQEPRRERPRNVTSITEERRQRRAGWGIWTTRIAMVVIVALVAGWFARPYLPNEVTERLPAAIVDGNGGDDIALNPVDTADESTSSSIGDGTNGAGTSPEEIMPTVAALGVGGATSEIPDPADDGEPSGPEGVMPTPTPADPSEAPGAGDSVEQLPGDTGTTQEPAQTEPQQDTSAEQTVQNVPAETTQPESGETGDTGSDTTTAPQQPEPTVAAPTEVPEIVVPTEEPEIVVPTEEPVIETPAPTEQPTEAPVIETVAPTEVPVTPTTEPTVASTEIPATEEPAPTEAPAIGTPEPTTEPEQPAPTQVVEAPAETEAPTLEPQAPSVTEEQPATQQFVDEGIRYSVEGASTGSSVPELPQIAEITYGEWIVLAVEGQNWTGSEQVFDMREFALIADGEEIQLDVGNSWVASMLGYTPAYGNTDAILWAPGEEHSFALTFLAPRDAQTLVLKAGDQEFDLGTILTETPSLAEMRQADAPDTIEAKVVDVIDGETMVIEKDGVQQTVRYLGIDAPATDECYTSEATEANRALVEGKTVKIERQATNVDAQGNWVRDVWVAQDDGAYVLVAHRMVQDGAVVADISEPNTRFASWLRGAEAVAKAEGRGLWGACQQGQGDTPATSLARVVAPARQVEI